MIKGIQAHGRYAAVTGGMSVNTYINHSSGNQGVGNVRYNTSTQNMEVYDGHNWIQLNSVYATVGLNGEAESLLDWASQKRDEERELEILAAKNPTISDLVEQKKTIDHKIKMMQILIKEDKIV